MNKMTMKCRTLLNFKTILIRLKGYLQRRIKKRPYLPLLLPPLVVLGVFFVIPLIALFVSSLQYYVPGEGVLSPFTLNNYIKFVTDSYYCGVLLKTLILGHVVALLTLIIGYPLAYFIARTSLKKKGLLVALVLFPLFVNIVVRSYGWIVLLARGGLVNQFLIKFNIIEQPLKLLFNYTGVLIGLTHIFIPFMVMVLVGAIQNIDPDYAEAAQVLGANKFQTFCRITLPLSLPGITSGFLLVLLLGVTAFVTPRLLGGITVKLMSNIIFQEFMLTFNWSFGAAMAYILLFVTLFIVLAYIKLFNLKYLKVEK